MWKGAEEEQTLIAGLVDAIEHMTEETPAEHRARVIGTVMAAADREAQKGEARKTAMQLAEQTSTDGEPRALDYAAYDLEELQALRLEVRDAICSATEGSEIQHVRPWLLRTESTGCDD